MSNELSTHTCLNTVDVAFFKGHAYPHKIVEYQCSGNSNEIWHVDLYQHNNAPFRATLTNRPLTEVVAEMDKDTKLSEVTNSPFKFNISDQIEKLIEFERNFQYLKTLDLVQILNSKFVHATPFGHFYNTVFESEKNAILFGPGGYGKSEMTLEVLRAANLQQFTYIKSFGEGLSEVGMLGGIDMKEMKDTGRMVYLLEQSFINDEMVILEEFLDAPPQVLLSLKDILTSGLVRNGTQQVPIKSRIVLGLTNIEPKNIATDKARAALLERFPLACEFVWADHSAEAYEHLLRKIYYKDLIKPIEEGGIYGFTQSNANFYIKTFSELLEKVGMRKENRISPRMARHGFDTIIAKASNKASASRWIHFSALNYVQGFSTVASEIKQRVEEAEATENSYSIVTEYMTYRDEVTKKIKDSSFIAKDLSTIKKEIDKFLGLPNNGVVDEHSNDYYCARTSLYSLADLLDELVKKLALSSAGVSDKALSSESAKNKLNQFFDLDIHDQDEWKNCIKLD